MTTSSNCAQVIENDSNTLVSNKEKDNNVNDTENNKKDSVKIEDNNTSDISDNKEVTDNNVALKNNILYNNTNINVSDITPKNENTQSIPNIIKDKIAILVFNSKDKENNSLLNSLQANILLHEKEYVVFNINKDIESILESLIEQNIMYATICNTKNNNSKLSILKYFNDLFNKYNNENIKCTLKEAGISLINNNNITGIDIAQCGLLTTVKPSSQNIQDIASGIFVLNNLSRTNTGQSAISQLGKVIGIETEIENTEKFIKRCINYKLDKKGGVLIKTTKPKQKENLLFPTIDCNTIIKAHDAKLDGIVISANYCRIIDINNTIKLANKRNIFILSI